MGKTPGRRQITVYLPPDQHDTLRAVAFRRRVPVSRLIQEMLDAYLKTLEPLGGADRKE
jgi:hypothetical protein